MLQIILEPDNFKQLSNFCGVLNSNLGCLENLLKIKINNFGNKFTIIGDEQSEKSASQIIKSLYQKSKESLITEKIIFQELKNMNQTETKVIIKLSNKIIKPRTKNQSQYLTKINQNSVNFGIGVAGTGKTYLAVASAVDFLNKKQIEKIILVRPAVEAGEKLGFLPGDLSEKIDPYLRPLYDALFDILGVEQVEKLIEKKIIEIAPLAFMRGRTLNDAFIILDEAQNTTSLQMKMFLTRIGFGSTAIVNGDLSQIDLPTNIKSGLSDVIEVLHNIKGISFTFFNSEDVVRHPLVQKIIEAYEKN